MSTLSLIVTSFNVGPWIEAALDSAARVLRDGDELIVVDDASRDDGPGRIRGFGGSGRLAPGVAFRPIFLGRNTPGGVGPAANIGLSIATGDIVGFLDGDDWLDATGFEAARARFEQQLTSWKPADMLVANYLEWHEAEGQSRPPADANRWHGAETLKGRSARHRAVSMIAVPWRKLYRRGFLEAQKLYFPEGDTFFEDNPFHWAACRAAKRIVFCDRVICHHRIARPGQTMASRGDELLAFFTHYDTITAGLGRWDRKLRDLALRWLLENLAWHMNRLAPAAIETWVMTAQKVLAAAPRKLWDTPTLTDHISAWEAETLGLIQKGETMRVLQRLQLRAMTRQEAHMAQALEAARQETDQLRRAIERLSPGQTTLPDPDLLAQFERLRHSVVSTEETPFISPAS